MSLSNQDIDHEIETIHTALSDQAEEVNQKAITKSALKLLGNFLQNINDLAHAANQTHSV